MKSLLVRRAALAAAVGLFAAASASGAVISSGLYRLHNHPDGNAVPPPYGARFDELYDETGNHDIFTLNFDHPSSAMFLSLDIGAGTISIFGQALGGRDIGGSHAVDQYLGLYTLNFTYNIGVAPVPGDDDIWDSTANHSNFGSIIAPGLLGATTLTDEFMGDYSFRLGDEDNDLGHRGFNGISGWGWMSYVYPTGIKHEPDTDWLFTAELVPTPGCVALLALSGGALASRRRRK